MIVIEDEDQRVGDGSDLVDQRDQDGLGRRRLRLRSLKRAQRAFSDVGLNGLQGRDTVDQEAGRVVVAHVEREPGESGSREYGVRSKGGIAIRPVLSLYSTRSVLTPCLYPFAQQHRLAKAGWGGDKGQLAVQSRVQLLNQARARD